MKKIYIILLDDDKWYKLPLRTNLFAQSQQSIVNQILEDEKQNYNGLYELNNKWILTINGFGKGLNAYIENISIEYGGFCTTDNEILLNCRFCKLASKLSKNSNTYKKLCHNEEEKDYWENVYNNEFIGGGKGLYKYLTHELHHSFQRYLIDNKEEILQQIDNDDRAELKKYIEQLDAYMNGDKIRIGYLDLNLNGNLCIKPYTSSKDETLQELSNIFYYLNISEYDAFNIENEKFNNLINKQTLPEVSENVIMSIDNFKKRYKNCLNDKNYNYNLNDIEDFVNIISNCILKVYNNEKPETPLEANIMYDISYIAHLEEMNLDSTTKQKREQKCIDLLQIDKKEKIIKEYYNIHPIKEKVKIYKENEFAFFLTKDKPLHNLSIEERENNPKLVLFLCSRNSDESYNYFKYATDELKEYCIENKYNLYNNEIYREGATIIFGEYFWKELGMEESYTVQEDVEYDDYVEEQENQYNSTDISSDNTFSQNYQDFNNDDEPEL